MSLKKNATVSFVVNAGRKIFMYEIADGKICDDCYNKLGKDIP